MSAIASLFNRQSRSKDKFITVLRPHIEVMYRMAYRWTGDQSGAEDLVQDVLVKLTARVDEIAELESPRPWLIKVLYRQFVDEHRREKRRLEVIDTRVDVAEESSANPSDPETSLLQLPTGRNPATQIDNLQQLEYALGQLEPDQLDVILLHDAEGYTDSETAEILDISKGTVKSRLHRGRKKIKKIIAGGTFASSASC